MRIEYLCGTCGTPFTTRAEADACWHEWRPSKRVVICDCGNEIRDNHNFCGRCGKEVKETE